MRIHGAIRQSAKGTAGFDRAGWRRLVASRAEFRRLSPRPGRNPFTGEVIDVHPPDDSADVVIEGSVVGSVWWSMSEEPLVNVSVEPALAPLVREWAEALGGEFHPDPPE